MVCLYFKQMEIEFELLEQYLVKIPICQVVQLVSSPMQVLLKRNIV